MKIVYWLALHMVMISMPVTNLLCNDKEINEKEHFRGITTFIAYSEKRNKIKEEWAVRDAEFNITPQKISERRVNSILLGSCISVSGAALYKRCSARQHTGIIGAGILTGTIAGVTFSAYKTSCYREFLQKHRFRKMD